MLWSFLCQFFAQTKKDTVFADNDLCDGQRKASLI